MAKIKQATSKIGAKRKEAYAAAGVSAAKLAAEASFRAIEFTESDAVYQTVSSAVNDVLGVTFDESTSERLAKVFGDRERVDHWLELVRSRMIGAISDQSLQSATNMHFADLPAIAVEAGSTSAEEQEESF